MPGSRRTEVSRLLPVLGKAGIAWEPPLWALYPLDLEERMEIALGAQTPQGTVSSGKVNTSVKILPVDVYGNNETTTTFDVANGIVQAVNNGADIINLSLGGTGDSSFLQSTINQVLSRGNSLWAAKMCTPCPPFGYSRNLLPGFEERL